MSLNCYYHPEREANTKCEKCEKLICLECKKLYTVKHGLQDSSYATQHELCIVCYYDIEMEKHKFSPKGYYTFLSILVTTIIVFLTLELSGLGPDFGNSPFGMWTIFTLMMSIFFLLCLRSYFRDKKRYPEILDDLKSKKENFLKTLQSSNV